MATPDGPRGPNPETNPYAPPGADLGEAPPPIEGGELARAEALRRGHITREIVVRLVGTFHLFWAGLSLLMLGAASYLILRNATGRSVPLSLAVLAVSFPFHVALGFGLRRLMSWARWLGVATYLLVLSVFLLGVAMSLMWNGADPSVLVIVAIVSAIPLLLLYLLLSRRTGVVFTPDYHEAVRLTPHVARSQGCLATWLGLVAIATVLLAVLLFGVGF